MERLPKIKERIRLPLSINVPPYLMDHQYQGKAVLPAVEAMEILAASTQTRFPGTAVHSIRDARFDKFLVLEADCDEINVFNYIESFDNGRVVSSLITRTRSKKAMITRTLEHATLCFHDVSSVPEPPPPGIPMGSGYHIPAESIYQSLVPFGPGYHNLKELTLFKEGAGGQVYAPLLGESERVLGSPFPLDAAFHAACVWGQRYAGLVGFPVGFGLRRLFTPTRSGNTYTARVFPKEIHSNRFLVDIWITDKDETLHEVVLDVVMKDVSGGRIKPPSWIVSDAGGYAAVNRGADYTPRFGQQ
jgi:Polyketide synthase dehydratase domain